MKRRALILGSLALSASLLLSACGGSAALNEIAEQYKTVAPNVELVFNFDSSGTLKTQIEEGADCDLFLSAAQKQMNALQDEDLINTNTRIDLLENKVVLAVPEGNPADIQSFEDIGTDQCKRIALGNEDVPVGSYSVEILTNLGILDELESGNKITYGSNVKEVTTQVSEASVDAASTEHADEAQAFLDYLTTDDAAAIFASVGFAMVK